MYIYIYMQFLPSCNFKAGFKLRKLFLNQAKCSVYLEKKNQNKTEFRLLKSIIGISTDKKKD